MANNATYLDRIKEETCEHLAQKLAENNMQLTDENYQALTTKLRATINKFTHEHSNNTTNTLSIIGNLYTPTLTLQYLNITQKELDKLVENHDIIELTDNHGNTGYPAFQFKNGTINRYLQKITNAYLSYEGADPMNLAIYLTTSSQAYGGKNLITHIAEYPENYATILNQTLADINDILRH